ncbi:GntR family transcriptional regulator [Streptomyces sp. TP-A0874]|uniref:GntR family transcriptional regulator n=1 Tax=Streptomyces sp. TP-A0874 TaxID=549819 RepID=UPI00085317AE|nr:GntR family transcriptional regulator [Streptomyces sp. TP-A0874]
MEQAARGVRRSSTAPGPGGRTRIPGQVGGEREAVRGGHDHDEPAPSSRPAERVPRRHSIRGQVLRALRSALACGELTPGQVYSAPTLAEWFGVSATPVREAMQQLAVERVVETVPNRGFRVAERTTRDLAELAEVRALLMVPVLLRMARTEPPERWEALRPLAAATVSAAARGDRIGYAETDRAFHRELLGLYGNQQLALLEADLHRRTQGPVRGRRIPQAADLLADAAEHTALLDALVSRDEEAVERLVLAHL